MPRVAPSSAGSALGPNPTFAQIAAYLDQHYPGKGYGDTFLAWVSAHNKTGAALDPHSTTFGAPPFNRAGNWLAAWLLLTDVGPGIGSAIGIAVGGAARQITGQILPGFAAGINSVTPSLPNFSSWLLRAAEIIAGAVLLAIGVNAMFKSRPLEIVTRTAGHVAKVVP